ncbi:MAG: hypothetical protein HKN34_03535 [Gammaproteobacteria bacterium]|nr:hypothetical protein [Gammaproteobacteria bacterium]
MKRSIGEYPGAFGFRFVSMLVIILVLILLFLHYLDESSKVIEQSSIQQTRKIVESSLLVVFATLATRRELNRLNELSNANPFKLLHEFELAPAGYRGEIDQINQEELIPGWYYVSSSRIIMYKPVYGENTVYFSIVLEYEDLNENGFFESNSDHFKRLYMKKLPQM